MDANPIVEFINARLAEDEQRALAAQRSTNLTPWRFVPDTYGGHHWAGSIEDEPIEPSDGGISTSENVIAGSVGEVAWGEHIADNDPAAALRRCCLIRAMLEHADSISDQNSVWVLGDMFERMYRDIAAYWSGHADYRPEWAPDDRGA